jgi:superfamily II DNA or RNA helicase
MKIKQHGRFIYFDDLNQQDIEKLKYLLTRETQERKIEFFFYNVAKNQYYTYFGFADYIKDNFNNITDVQLNELKNIEIDYNKIRNLGEITLRDYQVKVVEQCIKKKIGTVVSSVGSGKSIMMASLTNYLNKPTLIIVPTKQLVQQLYNSFKKVFDEGDLGVLCGDEKRVRKITIGTISTIKNQIHINEQSMSFFDIILMDEGHSTAQCETGLFINNFYQDREYLISFTGTLYRYENISKSIEDFIMLGFTGKPIAYIPIMYLVKKGYLAEPKIYMQNIYSMPKNIKNWHTVYRLYIEHNKSRNREIANFIKLFDRNNKVSLTLVNTKKHAQNIFDFLPDYVKEKTIIIYGNNSGMIWDWGSLKYTYIDYESVIDKVMRVEDWKHILATPVLSQGTDISNISGLILGFVGKAYTNTIQRIGRSLRLHDGKKYAFIIDFYDNTHGYLKAQSNKRRKIYNAEGFDIIDDFENFKSLVENA